MNITDEITHMQTRLRDAENKLEHERIRNAQQAGALRESRGQNAELLKRNEKLAARVATFEKHFHDFHGSAERIQKQKIDLDPPPAVVPVPETPNTILGKLSRLGLKTEVAA